MTNRPYQVAIITGPRHGGPLRWAKDLTEWVNRSDEAQATLISKTPEIFRSQLFLKADIVHSTVPITFRGWRMPLVLTVKGDYTIESPLWRPLYRIAIPWANTLTVPSEYLRRQVPALRSAEVIPNAVDLRKFKTSTPSTNGPVRLVMVTNFWYADKIVGVKQVIDHFRKAVEETKIVATLTIVGTGKYLPEVQAYARQQSTPVSFTGWADTKAFLADADMFLYSSNHDNMPNAVLEAMACGLPVLTNRVGAIDEMITSGVDGLVVDSLEQYEKELSKLLIDPDLRLKLGRAARERIERDFSWEHIVQRYLHIYRDLLK